MPGSACWAAKPISLPLRWSLLLPAGPRIQSATDPLGPLPGHRRLFESVRVNCFIVLAYQHRLDGTAAEKFSNASKRRRALMSGFTIQDTTKQTCPLFSCMGNSLSFLESAVRKAAHQVIMMVEKLPIWARSTAITTWPIRHQVKYYYG